MNPIPVFSYQSSAEDILFIEELLNKFKITPYIIYNIPQFIPDESSISLEKNKVIIVFGNIALQLVTQFLPQNTTIKIVSLPSLFKIKKTKNRDTELCKKTVEILTQLKEFLFTLEDSLSLEESLIKIKDIEPLDKDKLVQLLINNQTERVKYITTLSDGQVLEVGGKNRTIQNSVYLTLEELIILTMISSSFGKQATKNIKIEKKIIKERKDNDNSSHRETKNFSKE